MERDTYLFKKIKEHYNEIKDKYEVVGIFLQGSQNYGLDIYDDDYKSDVDTKAIVLPTFEDVVHNSAPISTTIVRENNEHIDVKDVRVMLDTFKKQNINFLEILFTKYKIINPKYKDLIQPLFTYNERIARLDINKGLNCQAGMSQQKYVALKHPYPTIIDKIEKFGYDPKQLHHIVRMFDFINKFVAGKPYSECLLASDRDYLIKIKKGALPLEQAEYLAYSTNKSTYEISKFYQKDDNLIDNFAVKVLDDVKFSLLKRYFTSQLSQKTEKKQDFEPRKIFFTSDNHFFHNNIIKFENRPFVNIEEMNVKMCELWNSVVSEDDLVYIVGDFSFGSAEETNKILKMLNGKKVLILGNHDFYVKSKKFDTSLFLDICNYKDITYKGKHFVMCHYPFASNDNKMINIYGHLHSNKENDVHWCDEKLLPKNSYNVGADVNGFVPVSIEHILSSMEEKMYERQ